MRQASVPAATKLTPLRHPGTRSLWKKGWLRVLCVWPVSLLHRGRRPDTPLEGCGTSSMIALFTINHPLQFLYPAIISKGLLETKNLPSDPGKTASQRKLYPAMLEIQRSVCRHICMYVDIIAALLSPWRRLRLNPWKTDLCLMAQGNTGRDCCCTSQETEYHQTAITLNLCPDKIHSQVSVGEFWPAQFRLRKTC